MVLGRPVVQLSLSPGSKVCGATFHETGMARPKGLHRMSAEQPTPLKLSSGLGAPHKSIASRIRVLLVDDHRMFRLGLRSVIDGCQNMEVVGEASDGVEAIEAVRLTRPDVVVMDINMPKMNGIQATQEIKKTFPDTAVIGHSVQTEPAVIRHMQAAGVSSYVKKESAAEELCAAIEDAMAPKADPSPASSESTVPHQQL